MYVTYLIDFTHRGRFNQLQDLTSIQVFSEGGCFHIKKKKNGMTYNVKVYICSSIKMIGRYTLYCLMIEQD